MSLHPSLRQSDAKAGARSILKREERIKKLISEGKWKNETSVFGLPKVKIVRMKITKKGKEAKQEEGKAQEKNKEKEK